jgi:hypothetical protein
MQGRRAALGRPAVAVLLVLVAMAVWFYGPSFPQDPEVFCPGYRALERTPIQHLVLAWPPGATNCEYTTSTGEAREST